MNEDDISRAATLVAASRYVIALVGAGISVESGIPPFRGKDGLWTKRGEPPMDGYQRFMMDPAAGWRTMLEGRAARTDDDEFRRALDAAQPNAGHHALAELERIGVLRHTISQNIDNLHVMAGSVALTEIHGNRTKVRCIDCNARWPWDEFLARAAIEDESRGEVVAGVRIELPPSCPDCRSIVKSDVVSFGEPIPQDALAECYRQAEQADCVIVVGTSAVVYPAAYFPEIVLNGGGVLVEVNLDETGYTPHATVALRGPSGQLLPALVAAIRTLA